MGYFNKRFLKYETNASDNNYLDYGEVVQVITDRLINVNMGGSGFILEAVGIEGNYIPRVGDWVTVEWSNGSPIARGGSNINGGLKEPNAPIIISTDDLADGTINSDHIRTNTIEARHISAYSIQAEHISANSITSDKISANAIQTQHISSNTITATQIQAGAINAVSITANAINATHITANAINSVHINANAIQVQHLSANSVQTNQISANSIDATKIKADAINATHISANSITSSEISANAITATHITANAITTQHLSANSITGEKIQANQVSANHITANAINATHITANAINAQHITANSISANHITANAIRTEHISANSVQAGHISSNSIQTGHISANTINSGHIQAGVINATHITANAITSQHISSNTIQGQHISSNSITGNHIVAGTIQSSHISSNSINAGHITANAINATHITANAINAQHITANAIRTQHLSANSIYGDKISANQISANHITANAINANHITANAIQAQHISANSIQTQHISSNSITGDKISGGTITGDKISGGAIDTDHLTVGTRKEGLLGQYYTYTGSSTNKFQTYKGHQIDPTVNFSWGTGSPTIVGQNDNFAVRWQGFIYAPESGTYSFHLTADDLGKIVVNNTVVVNIPSYTGVETTGTISLTQGQWYPILIEAVEGTGGATAIVKWTKPSLVKEVVPSKYYTQGNTVIDGATITTASITASSMQVGTITAQSGILADASITTATIKDGIITSAKIGTGEIKTANIASGNITNALIADATIQYAKIASVNADTITVGRLNGQLISGGTITGDKISGNSITGDKIVANSIDSLQIKSGAITTTELAGQSITADKIQSGAITSDSIRAGSITADHISTIGLDAQVMQVYNSQTGETLIGGGYLRVDGLDAGVIQSDNLLKNGLFLASSSDYGFKRENPSGEALLGNTATGIGAHQVWKIDLTTGVKVKAIDIPAKKPVDIAIHPTGNFAYITVQGDDTMVQLDLVQDVLTTNTKKMGMGPARIKFVGEELADHKHLFVLNSDPMDMNVPDSFIVVDSPPSSVNGDLYIHHKIPLGNEPYDLVLDSNLFTYITMAGDGDVLVIDTSAHDSHLWKVKGRIPISAYGTDNAHGGLDAMFGLNEVTGGDASSQYNASESGQMSMSMSHSHGGYGDSDGSLKKYRPHGIEKSTDADTLYVIDNENGELVVIDKTGTAPYNALTGRDTSAESPIGDGMETDGGGPRTTYVRYRIPVGDSPDFVRLINGKLFISLGGSNSISVIDEQQILDEIQADRDYYGAFLGESVYENWNPFEPMRTTNTFTVRTIKNVGSKPSFMNVVGGNLYVTLGGQNQIVKINPTTETVTMTINVGTNPKGFDFTPDGRYMYVANYGGSGDLSFIYPTGSYIGDPFMGLEGGILYQGADGWTPDRSDWIYDASGNIRSKSAVEFHVNEPLLNEGGYSKLTTYGYDYQYAQIEQDITNITNYSNGNNLISTVGERLYTVGTGNTIFRPKAGEWLNSPAPSNIKIGQLVSGSTVRTSASANTYTIYYSPDSRIEFSANAIPSGGWVEADYTARNNIYFKTHNASTLVAIDNGSSPNFNVTYEVDEFVPKFVVADNQQTAPFTPSANGINEQYTGLEYSTITNRAKGMTVTTSVAPTSGTVGLIVNDYEVDALEGDTTANPLPPSSGGIVLPSGNQWIKVDLGSTYMIGKISVSHKYGVDRVYKGTKTEVSEDGNTWYTVYDSAVSGTYNEKPTYHSLHDHTHYAKFITFDAKPVRYVRDWANGWTSGDGQTSGNTSDWTEIKVYGDWQLEKGYVYPTNSPKAGQQIATNGKGFVSTDISKAYVAMNIQIEFTSWWYMTYIVGPQFGKIEIEMPTLMNSGHYLSQEAPFVNNVAHRHVMSFPPSENIKEDVMKGVVAGKHRVIIRQESGKVTLDRLRFEDFQYNSRSSLLIPTSTSATLFKRYKVVSEQTKWYQGQGLQSTEGAYDTPRTNPDTGIPDKSVPIKYRVRLRTELNADGSKEERGTAYVTSSIFETGKLSTHWRRSESADVFPAHKIEKWNGSQPHKTGIQHDHLANGAVRAEKILPNTIMDWHISNYARISEHKLDLNHPTHEHGRHNIIVGAGPLGTDLHIWEDNLELLNSIENWAGASGNYGTANTLSRGDHKHDDLYLTLNGGQLTGTLNAKAINTSGNVSVTGNITVTGTVDGVDVSNLNASFVTVSANTTNHIGSGGSAHAVAVSGGANGFIDGSNYGKLLRIQDNAINQTTADGIYAKLSGNNLNGTTIGKSMEHGSNSLILGNNDWTPLIYYKSGGSAYYNSTYRGVVLSGNSTWIKVKTRLPIDPDSTYFVRAKVTKKSGAGTFYIGADSLDNNYLSISTDQAMSYNYFGATGVTIASGNTQYFEATISGYNATSGSSANKFDPEAKYFDLVMIGNYGDTSGTAETLIEWLELYKAPNTFYIGSNLVIHSGNFNTTTLNGHAGSGGSAHALANATTHGFMSFNDFNKLGTVATSANNYIHPTGDGNMHVPANGTGYNQYVLKATATAGVTQWGIVDWSELGGKPSTFTPSAHTHSANQITDLYSNIYTKSEVDTAVTNAGDIKASQANIFKNTNTFNIAGLGIKIQPSANVTNSTKLFQVNNTSGNELFSINYSGGVAIAGDFTVTGVQTYSGTTTVNGDYTVNGQLIVGGNSTLGDASTDITTVNGTLKVQNGSIQEIGKYVEVHRRPIYGIAGDLQFQTDSITFEDIVDYYDLSAFALPSVKSGATRYYRLYVIYSDDINSTQSSAGQKATIRISGGTDKDLDLPLTWGAVNGRRDWFSSYFTDLPTGNGKIQAKLATTGNNLGIRWVELVAYDKF
jgi:YVTN family beta-propeller protein